MRGADEGGEYDGTAQAVAGLFFFGCDLEALKQVDCQLCCAGINRQRDTT